MAGFAGFSPDALKFLAALKKNNSREWFQPRKDEYERLWRAPMIELVTALHRDMEKFAPEYVHDPAKAVLRIYRDTRFSKNKTPYKTHVAATLRRMGLDKEGGAFYFHVDEAGLLVAGGVYAPMPEELRAIRALLAERGEEFRKLLKTPKLKELMGELQGEMLTRVPKGFQPDHPSADLLRRKQFFFQTTVGPEAVTTPELYPELLKRIKALYPVVEYLNAPLLGLAKSKDSRFLSDFA